MIIYKIFWKLSGFISVQKWDRGLEIFSFNRFRLHFALFQKHSYSLQNDQEIYISKLKELINDNGTRLIVNLNHVRQKMPQRAIGSISIFTPQQTYPLQAAEQFRRRDRLFTAGGTRIGWKSRRRLCADVHICRRLWRQFRRSTCESAYVESTISRQSRMLWRHCYKV